MRVGIVVMLLFASGSGRSQELIREILGGANQYFGERLVSLDDVNGDGVRDLLIVASNYGTIHQSGFVRGVSGRTGSPLYEIRSSNQLRGFPFGVALFDDDDGDGVRDFVASELGVGIFSGRTGALIRVLTQYGTGTLMAVGDVDGDGKSELVVGSSVAGGAVLVSGRTGVIMWQIPMPGGGPWSPIVVPLGDVTGDGWPDFGGATPDPAGPLQTHKVSVFSPREARVVWSLGYQTNGLALLSATPDQDNDGRLDLAFGVNNLVEVVSSRGARIRTLTFGMRAEALGLVGDIDGDGREDLAIGERWAPARVNILSTRNWSTIYSFDTTSLQHATAFAGLGDMNGDGRNDFAVGFLCQSAGCVRFYGPVPADYREFGAGCAGAAGVPRLSVVRMPRVGEPFEVRIAPVSPLSFTVLLLGASNSAWGGLTLPVDLGDIGMPSCTLLASGEASVALFSTTGTTGWSTTIPADYTLLRARFYNQAFPFDARANALGVIATNGGEAYIGG